MKDIGVLGDLPSSKSTVDVFLPVQLKKGGFIYGRLNFVCINDNNIETPGKSTSKLLF